MTLGAEVAFQDVMRDVERRGYEYTLLRDADLKSREPLLLCDTGEAVREKARELDITLDHEGAFDAVEALLKRRAKYGARVEVTFHAKLIRGAPASVTKTTEFVSGQPNWPDDMSLYRYLAQ